VSSGDDPCGSSELRTGESGTASTLKDVVLEGGTEEFSGA